MEVSRTFGTALQSSLVAATSNVGVANGRFELSSSVTVPASIVDTVKTMWSTNPFGSVGSDDVSSTSIVEFSVRDASSGNDVALNGSVSGRAADMPIVFWMAVSPGEYYFGCGCQCVRVRVCVFVLVVMSVSVSVLVFVFHMAIVLVLACIFASSLK